MAVTEGSQCFVGMAWAEDRAIPARREPERRPKGQDRRPGGLLVARLPLPFRIGMTVINPAGRSPELLEEEKIVNTERWSPG